MAERIQRFMMAGFIAAGLVLHSRGYAWGLYLDWFVVAMALVWAVTGVCPSLVIMRKLGLPSEADRR